MAWSVVFDAERSPNPLPTPWWTYPAPKPWALVKDGAVVAYYASKREATQAMVQQQWQET